MDSTVLPKYWSMSHVWFPHLLVGIIVKSELLSRLREFIQEFLKLLLVSFYELKIAGKIDVLLKPVRNSGTMPI